MNKRIMLGILAGGLITILALASFGIFQMQGFRNKLQITLNEHFDQISKEIALNDLELDYAPFQCQGLVFIECKSPYAKFFLPGFKEAIFSGNDLNISLKELDFKSATLGIKGQFQYGHFGDLQEYIQAFFPQDFQLELTIKPQNSKRYTVHTKLLLNAQNAQYIENLTSIMDSPKVQELGLFKHISSFAFLDEGIKIQNFEFSLISKNLSDKLFEIIQNKYGKSLDKKSYSALVAFLMGSTAQRFASKPYYPQIQELFNGLLSVILWEADKMQIFISPKTSQDIQPIYAENMDTLLDILFYNYNFQVNLSTIQITLPSLVGSRKSSS